MLAALLPFLEFATLILSVFALLQLADFLNMVEFFVGDGSIEDTICRWLCIGGMLGLLSLLAWAPKSLPMPWRLANLLLTPIIAAYLVWRIHPLLLRKATAFQRTRSFWRAFSFSLGVVTLRFIFA
ncbi:hypothetical protein [Chitinimonas sp.]|uniref:hypothetical protein n=1 Tax=Chitinimonas sp. TaxID=1934313 RepID=UPI0035B36E5B